MPLNVLLTFIIGAVLGLILVKLIRAPSHLHGLVLGCCTAGNYNHIYEYGHMYIEKDIFQFNN